MELSDYGRGRQEQDASPPTNWQPSSPSIARKPVGAGRQTSPWSSPEHPSQSFASRVSSQQSYFPRQTDRDAHPYGSTTPLGIWEPIPPTPSSVPRRPQHHRDDSQASLLSPYMSEGPPRQSPPQTHFEPQRPERKLKFANWWLTEWRPSWSMYALVVAGVGFAMGHHFFYHSLHGKVADDQQGMFRYGAALAFLSKACFLNAVVLAFRQRVLMMIRRKMLTLSTLDSLFAASEDLTALLNWEAWVNAKFAMFLTIFIWTSPLIVILTSYTLTVEPLKKEEITKCPEIRTLNFSHEEIVDFREPLRVKDWIELSVSRWNTTTMGATVNPKDPDEFDYWTDTSQQFRAVALKTAYAQQAIMRKDAPEQICGKGWNCSYTIEFTGPGYKCEKLASGINAEVKKLGDAECPFNTSILAPAGNLTYNAILDQGDYAKQQIDSGVAGIPKQKPPYPKNLGVFRTEPVLWFGFAEVEDRSKRQPLDPTSKEYKEAYTPAIYGCEHYKTKYTVQFNHSGGTQEHFIKKREYLDKVIDTTYIKQKDPDKRLKDRTQAVPEENYVHPHDIANYRLTAAYHSLGSLLRSLLNGTITLPNVVAETQAIETRLIDRLNYLTVEDFPEQVQSFYEEILVSFLSDPQFITVSWAYDPSRWSGQFKGGEKTDYKCVRWQVRGCYFYNYAQLWAVYAISMGITVVAVASGIAAIQEDSMMRSLSFSAILAATRGTSLDKLRWEREADIMGSKIGFGVVSGHTGERTYSFGVEGDVSQEKATSTARSPAISVMGWGDRAARRMSYAVLNRRGENREQQ
ncbi:hypothetical protein FALBO_7297 [Fusarium albosuccineum]|uniref:Uncharacterized protein n=1 Tax=Fusarium albosuccineum TaxID=1237068 RepID=A0A8H4LAH7_9HYPO|nr:hypothetical protein FALBO_7297 [Fusarium albosuccineum]